MKPLNRNIAPSFKTIEKINIQKAKKHILSNNIPVYIINAGSENIVKTEFIFDSGYWYQDKPLIARFTNGMLSEGSKNYTSAEISKQIDYFGSYLNLDVNYDSAEASLYTSTKHFKETIKIISDIIKNPIFPENELSTFIDKKKQQFLIDNSKVNILAKQKFSEVLFGQNHPYGRKIELESFKDVTKKQLFDFHTRYYNISNCKIIISGKVTKNEIDIIEKYFGGNDWIGFPEVNNLKLNPEGFSSKQVLVEQDDAVQSAIRIGKVLFNKLHPDFIGMEVLNKILGGYFGSRLMKNIREDKGYTYGIASFLIPLKQEGFWVISSEVGSDVSKKAINEIHKEIVRLQNETIPEDELELVKNYILGNLLKNFDGPFASAESLKSILDFDLKYDYFEKYIREIKKIDSKELKVLAQKYLNIDSMYEVIAGKKL